MRKSFLFILMFLCQSLLATNVEGLILNCKNNGLFSEYSFVITFLDKIDKEQVSAYKIDFGRNGLYYDPQYGSNWWNYYFVPIEATPANVPESDIDWKMCDIKMVGYELLLERGRFLTQKYVRVLPFIQRQVEEFKKSFFRKALILGVHYRGTDKRWEAPLIPYDDICAIIDRELAELESTGKPVVIFLATDEQAFVDVAKKRY